MAGRHCSTVREHLNAANACTACKNARIEAAYGEESDSELEDSGAINCCCCCCWETRRLQRQVKRLPEMRAQAVGLQKKPARN